MQTPDAILLLRFRRNTLALFYNALGQESSLGKIASFVKGQRLAGGPGLFSFQLSKMGCPILRAPAKGGNHTAGAMGFGLNCAGMGSMTNPMGNDSIVSHPCKKRKDGAPSFRYRVRSRSNERLGHQPYRELHTDSFSEKM
jgi:hypothetical protein